MTTKQIYERKGSDLSSVFAVCISSRQTQIAKGRKSSREFLGIDIVSDIYIKSLLLFSLACQFQKRKEPEISASIKIESVNGRKFQLRHFNKIILSFLMRSFFVRETALFEQKKLT